MKMGGWRRERIPSKCVASEVTCGLVVSASAGSFEETSNLRPQPRPTYQALHFNKSLGLRRLFQAEKPSSGEMGCEAVEGGEAGTGGIVALREGP